MKEMTLKEIQDEELALLERFAQWCDSHGVRYFLAAGSLLGAVRGGAPIPWDDDIDVLVPRPDYDRLVADFSGDSRCELLSPGEGYPWNFSKLVSLKTRFVEDGLAMPDHMGVYVDIFPVDGLPPEGYDARMADLRFAVKVAGVVFARDYSSEANRGGVKNALRRLASIVGRRLFSQQALAEKIQDICRWSPFESSDKVGVLFGAYGAPREEYPRRMFDGNSEVMFSGRNFKTFADPESYLTHMYGDDWRTPTPQSPRVHGKAWMQEGGDVR